VACKPLLDLGPTNTGDDSLRIIKKNVRISEDRKNDLEIWRVAGDIFNKQTRSLGVGSD
jgi:hypothetical protein